MKLLRLEIIIFFILFVLRCNSYLTCLCGHVCVCVCVCVHQLTLTLEIRIFYLRIGFLRNTYVLRTENNTLYLRTAPNKGLAKRETTLFVLSNSAVQISTLMQHTHAGSVSDWSEWSPPQQQALCSDGRTKSSYHVEGACEEGKLELYFSRRWRQNKMQPACASEQRACAGVILVRARGLQPPPPYCKKMQAPLSKNVGIILYIDAQKCRQYTLHRCTNCRQYTLHQCTKM